MTFEVITLPQPQWLTELDPGRGGDHSGKRCRRRGARLDSRRRGGPFHDGRDVRVPRRDAGNFLRRRDRRFLRYPEPMEFAGSAEPLDSSRGPRRSRRSRPSAARAPRETATPSPRWPRRESGFWRRSRKTRSFRSCRSSRGWRESSTRRFEGRACRRLTSPARSPFSCRKTEASIGAKRSVGSSSRRGRIVTPASVGTPGGAMANWTWSDSSRSSPMLDYAIH